MSFESAAISQELCFPLDDAQGVLKNEKECDIDRRELAVRKEQDTLKDKQIANLEKENELLKRESELKDKVIGIKDMELAAKDRAIAGLEKVTDRAIKLAEVSKPQSNWQFQGLAAIAALLLGFGLGK